MTLEVILCFPHACIHVCKNTYDHANICTSTYTDTNSYRLNLSECHTLFATLTNGFHYFPVFGYCSLDLLIIFILIFIVHLAHTWLDDKGEFSSKNYQTQLQLRRVNCLVRKSTLMISGRNNAELCLCSGQDREVHSAVRIMYRSLT